MKRFYILLNLFFTLTHLWAQDTITNHFTVAAVKNNIVYKGIANPISISVSDCPVKNLIIKTNNGLVTGENGFYKVTPSSGHILEVSVFVIQKKDTNYVGMEKFRIKELPTPRIFPAWCNRDSTANKFDLIEGGGIITGYEAFEYDIRFPIKSFELKTIKDGKEIILKSEKSAYTNEMKEQIKKCEKGDELIFQNFLLVYPDQSEKFFDRRIVIRVL